MSYLLFPNFYAAAAWHALKLLSLSLRWNITFSWLTARMAFWTHLGESFKKFEKGE